jgi:hypothetical protein
MSVHTLYLLISHKNDGKILDPACMRAKAKTPRRTTNPKWIDRMWTRTDREKERELCTAVNVCFWKIIQKVVPACAIISARERRVGAAPAGQKIQQGKSIITETHRLRRRQRPFNCITTHVALGRPPIMWLTHSPITHNFIEIHVLQSGNLHVHPSQCALQLHLHLSACARGD